MCIKGLEKSYPRSDKHACYKELTEKDLVLRDLLGHNPDDGAVEQLVASKKQN
jgi:hypothetical protein